MLRTYDKNLLRRSLLCSGIFAMVSVITEPLLLSSTQLTTKQLCGQELFLVIGVQLYNAHMRYGLEKCSW